MLDWDDVRIFLAVARARSLGAAAARLRIDTATVGRRITRLETSLRSTLLVRSRSGITLTAVGAQLMEAGLEAEAAMNAALSGAQTEAKAGTVRISASEGFGGTILAPALAWLVSHHPGLRIELAANAGFLSPTRREVDMAVTLTASHEQRVVVEPLTYYQLALYAAPSYLNSAAVNTLEDLRQATLVGYVEDLIYAQELRYLDEILHGLKTTLSSSSIQAQRAIIDAGGGIGVLPCFMAGDLKRVLPETVLLERRFWLSTHQDVHDTARVRNVRHWLTDLIDASQNRLRPYPSL